MMSASTLDDRLEITATQLIAIHPNLSKASVVTAGRNFYSKLVIGEIYRAKNALPGDMSLVVADKSALENGLLDQDYGLKEVGMIKQRFTLLTYFFHWKIVFSFEVLLEI